MTRVELLSDFSQRTGCASTSRGDAPRGTTPWGLALRAASLREALGGPAVELAGPPVNGYELVGAGRKPLAPLAVRPLDPQLYLAGVAHADVRPAELAS